MINLVATEERDNPKGPISILPPDVFDSLHSVVKVFELSVVLPVELPPFLEYVVVLDLHNA
jgi:hypothetical protein